MTVETTLITPVLIMLLVIVAVMVHRGVDARLRLDDAAHQAARAASLERNGHAARTQARSTAARTLSTAGVVCQSQAVTTMTSGRRGEGTTDLIPGGTITVTVSCTVDLGDAVLLGIGDSKRLSATATEPIDTYRSATETASGGNS